MYKIEGLLKCVPKQVQGTEVLTRMKTDVAHDPSCEDLLHITHSKLRCHSLKPRSFELVGWLVGWDVGSCFVG